MMKTKLWSVAAGAALILSGKTAGADDVSTKTAGTNAVSSTAGGWWQRHYTYDAAPSAPLFNAHELSLDLGGSVYNEDLRFSNGGGQRAGPLRLHASVQH